MNRALKVVGKLSLWGLLLAFLLWLGQQLLAYLLALIMPWLQWLFGWLILILTIFIFIGIAAAALGLYMAFRAWKRKSEEKEEKKVETTEKSN